MHIKAIEHSFHTISSVHLTVQISLNIFFLKKKTLFSALLKVSIKTAHNINKKLEYTVYHFKRKYLLQRNWTSVGHWWLLKEKNIHACDIKS